MKKSGFMAGLHKSTKMTVISCACFLAMSAAIILFLMICPIEHHSSHMYAQSVSTDIQPETQPPEETYSTQPAVTYANRPLSTWAVTFKNGEFDPAIFSDNNEEDVQDETLGEEEQPVTEDLGSGSPLTYTEVVTETEPSFEPDEPDPTDPPPAPETDPPKPDIPETSADISTSIEGLL